MGAGRRTAIGVVAKLMDMKSMLGIGIISCEIPRNSGRGFLINLLKAYYPGNFRVAPNKSNCAGLVSDLELSSASSVPMWTPRMPKKTRLYICNNWPELMTSQEKRSYRLLLFLVLGRFKNEIFSRGRKGKNGRGAVSWNLLDTWAQIWSATKKTDMPRGGVGLISVCTTGGETGTLYYLLVFY